MQENVYQMDLCGEIDACSAIVLDEELAKAIYVHPRHICIDCEKLTYISSAGLGAFISHLQKIKECRINLVLYNVSPAIAYVFEIIGLDRLINVQGHLHEADSPVPYTLLHTSSNGDKPLKRLR